MGQYRRHSELHEAAKEARAVPRYDVPLPDGTTWRMNERQRLALSACSSTWGREDNRNGPNPGSIANVLGDGNGWTGHVTLRSLLVRGLVGYRFLTYSTEWWIEEPGVRALAAADRQYELTERCPACDGKAEVRNPWQGRPETRGPECEACNSTGLVPR